VPSVLSAPTVPSAKCNYLTCILETDWAFSMPRATVPSGPIVQSAKCSYLARILVRKLRQPLSLSDSPIDPHTGSQFNPQFGFSCKLGEVSCKLGQVRLSLQLTLPSTLRLGLSLTLSLGSLYVNLMYRSILFLVTDKSF
jgi:hypothetical protein